MRKRTNQQGAAVCAIAAALAFAAPAASGQAPATEAQLRSTIAAQMAQGPAAAGAYVVDLSDGHVVVDDRSRHKRLSASVTKLYTTATALTELGPGARLSTRVLGTGRREGATWTGDLYLRGGGDFTFGTRSFARKAYGSRATVERLAAALRRSGIRRVDGSVFGDATLYRDNGGTPFELALCPDPLFGRGCPYGPAGKLERPIPNGPRTPIGFNRGLRSATGAEPQGRPARFAARGLIRALRRAGVRVDAKATGANPRSRLPKRRRIVRLTARAPPRPEPAPATSAPISRNRLSAA